MENPGWLCLIPSLLVLVIAIYTKKSFEALLIGVLVGFGMVYKFNFFDKFVTTALKTMSDESFVWVVLVCGLMGSLVTLLIKSGGQIAFGSFLEKYIKTRKSALFVTWLFPLLIFVDDYLIGLTVGSTMKKITDKYKVSRELLTYIISSTAACLCVIVPISTWSLFLGQLIIINTNDPAVKAMGVFNAYLKVIPYVFFGWTTVFLVPFVILGIVPMIGGMKKAEKRVIETGEIAPPESPEIAQNVASSGKKPRLINFIVPLVALLVFTLLPMFSNGKPDAFHGSFMAVLIAGGMFLAQKLLNIHEYSDTFFEGFATLIYPLAIIFMSFMLKDINEHLGLATYVITSVKPIMSAHLLPVVAFVVVGILSFTDGSFWGVLAIVFPIIYQLSYALNADIWLTTGALISAGVFGSHSCVFGDTTVLISRSSGCNIMAHVTTQIPYVVISFILASLMYWGVSYIL